MGEFEVAGVTANGRLLLPFGMVDEEACCSRSLCLAFATKVQVITSSRLAKMADLLGG